MVVVAINGHIVSTTKAARRFLRFTPSSLQPHCAFDAVHPDDHDEVRSLLGANVTIGRTAIVRISNSDGSWRSVQVVRVGSDPDAGFVKLSLRNLARRNDAEACWSETLRRMSSASRCSWSPSSAPFVWASGSTGSNAPCFMAATTVAPPNCGRLCVGSAGKSGRRLFVDRSGATDDFSF